ncbi:MAG: ATP-binding protein [Clostridiales bacterium]|jgi:DNA replication protein DnaC|nr:ATP-binding protein [Clostridiales bacterium]
MGYSAVFKECMREYEKTRDKSAALLNIRKREIYGEIPRIEEIDGELSQTGLALTKLILTSGNSKADYVKELGKKNAALVKEKAKLLNGAGFKRTYLDGIYECKLCKDTGFADGKRCSCFKQKLIDKHYGLSNLHGRLKSENFDYFDIRYYSEEKDPKTGISPRANIERIYQVCMDFVTNFDEKYTNLLFYGDTGLGKTFLCNCIAKDLLDAGKTVLYVTAPKLFKFFDDYRFNREETDAPSEYLEMVHEADLLIIDDLGAEFSTVIGASELFNIINARILDKKHTVISTNLKPGTDFEDTYSQRIVSRFVGNYVMLKFIGKDIRLSKKYSSRK